MKGFSTTYLGMFDDSDDGRPAVRSIEIPIIQRDYAQGREDAETAAIRRDFLDVLVRALTSTEAEGLDFVYGEVSNGVLKPLDGQQRLTTLFLLHWYVASRAGAVDPEAPWTRFRYATRLSAEYFCRELVANPWPQDGSDPVAWITDQSWYLFPWRADPTIQSMLVMIGAIHGRLLEGSHDMEALWQRLTSAEAKAISFLFLPIEDMDSGDDLYIKMNSRGKSLTNFEVFKARFEQLLGPSGRKEELSGKLDREWADLLWHYEGGDFLVDEEFMNYLSFIIDVCEWRTGSTRSEGSLIQRAARLFVEHEDRATHLDLLFFAFDTWVVAEEPSRNLPVELFPELFSVGAGAGPGLRFFESQDPNLFATCLKHYASKQFSLAETLFLYGVIISRQACPGEHEDVFTVRLRSLRNIAESAPDDVRSEWMPELVASTTKLMTDATGTCLDGLKRFNQGRIDDEKLKRDLLTSHAHLRAAVQQLEDHPLLRGRLFAFELDPATLPLRGTTFRQVTADEVLPRLGAALLTKGDYSRSLTSGRKQFGVPGSKRGGGSWRDVLTFGSRDTRRPMRDALERLLEDVAERQKDVGQALEAIVDQWLAEQQEAGLYDWRYYFVRYPSMLAAPHGIYVGERDPAGAGLGYRVDMLNGQDYRSAFTDPYLSAIWSDADRRERVLKPEFRSWDDTGTEKAMRLGESGTGIRSRDAGFEILLPHDADVAELARSSLGDFALSDENVVQVQQRSQNGRQLDAEDRVQVGVQVVQALLDAGL